MANVITQSREAENTALLRGGLCSSDLQLMDANLSQQERAIYFVYLSTRTHNPGTFTLQDSVHMMRHLSLEKQ